MGQQKSPLFLGLQDLWFFHRGVSKGGQNVFKQQKIPAFFEVSGQALVDLLNHAKENGYAAW